MSRNCHTEYLPDVEAQDVYVITNHIQGFHLQSWWVFRIMTEQVEGLLMDDLRGNMWGPFTSVYTACDAIGVTPLDLVVKPY